MPKLSIATWVHGYDRSNLKFDIIAGLSVWALVVPQSIAYAQIAGLPPQAGVFCSFAAPLGYALFGTSRQLIVSPTSATAAISASLVGSLALGNIGRYTDLSMMLAILSGILFILLGYWKLGFVSQFIATSVQVGFLFGLGMTIICGQVFDLLGIESTSGPFYKQFWGLITHLDETNGWTAVIGVGGLIALFALKRFAPGVPSALLLVGVAIVVVTVFNLADHGVAIVGQIDRAIPLPGIPTDIKFSDLATLLPGTLAIVIIGYSESVSIAEQFADEHKYDIKPNRELTALGVSAMLSGFFKGFISGGGASQSAANDRAGAKTQFAGGGAGAARRAHLDCADAAFQESSILDSRGDRDRCSGRLSQCSSDEAVACVAERKFRPGAGSACRGANRRHLAWLADHRWALRRVAAWLGESTGILNTGPDSRHDGVHQHRRISHC